MKYIKKLLLLLLFSNSLFATVYNTTGTSSSWTNGAAWNIGTAPSMTQWDGSHDPSVAHDMTYTGDMTISSGNVLTIKSGATLTITGTLKMGWNSNPGLVVEAGGRLIVNAIQYDSSPSAINNSGTINVTTTFTCGTAGILNTSGTFTTGGNFTISSSANIDLSGTNSIAGNLSVTGAGTDFDLNSGSLSVTGNVIFNGDGNVTIDGDMTVAGNASVTGTGGASVDGTFDVDGLLTIDNNGDVDGYGIVDWGTLSANPNCSPALLICSGTGTSLDNNTVGWCAGTYASPPGPPVDLNTCTAATLPVELLSFVVSGSNGIIKYLWETGSEINNSHFELQSSIDGINWFTEAIVLGAGNSFESIKYVETIKTNSTYFRLKQVDYDGTSSYSNIRTINTNSGDVIEYLPDPNYIIIKASMDFDLLIFDINGKLVYKNNYASGIVVLSKNILSNGWYVLSIDRFNYKFYNSAN